MELLSLVIAGRAAKRRQTLTFGNCENEGRRAFEKMCVRMRFTAFGIWGRAWWALTRCVRGRYRPEKHYMRGPGPKYRAQGIEPDTGKTTVTTSVSDEPKAG